MQISLNSELTLYVGYSKYMIEVRMSKQQIVNLEFMLLNKSSQCFFLRLFVATGVNNHTIIKLIIQ